MKKMIVYTVAVILLCFMLTVALDFWGVGGKSVEISIPSGSTAHEIVKLLKENKVIISSPLFIRYIQKDAASLKAGVHTFTQSMGYKKIKEELLRDVPLENVRVVTVQEGYEKREIALLLENEGVISAQSFEAACQDAHIRFSFLPEDGNVEGYLFPATYNFMPDTDADAVVDSMVKKFEEEMLKEEYLVQCEKLSMSFHEVLTLASIIEREAAMETERTIISSVFHNRLRQNMRLESCATVQYILEERKEILSVADTKIESPYNTYMHAGLPPAPIASPGIDSFRAALYPATTNYLFFVADGSGGHVFSETYEEHVKAVEKYT